MFTKAVGKQNFALKVKILEVSRGKRYVLHEERKNAKEHIKSPLKPYRSG